MIKKNSFLLSKIAKLYPDLRINSHACRFSLDAQNFPFQCVVSSRTCKRADTTVVETYGEHMGNIWGARAIPICSPYVPHMFGIWGKFQKQPNHMWPICCLTYGETYGLRNNIWGTYGKCGHFCIQISSSEHMGNIWETYGEHMGNIWGAHPKQHPTKPFPSPADAAPSRTVRLPQSLF